MPGLLVVGAIVGVVALGLQHPDIKESRERRHARRERTPLLNQQWAPHESEVAQFLKLPAARRSEGRAYIRGRVLALDQEKRAIDYAILADLPEDLAATRPGEVKTVVLTKWDSVLTGTYSRDASGYAVTCEVIVLDSTIPAILARRSFRGPNPPRKVPAGSGHQIGSKPIDDIGDYLTSLPRVDPIPTPTALKAQPRDGSPPGRAGTARVRELWNEGAANLHAGDRSGAIESFQAALKLDLDNQGIKDKLKQLRRD